LTNENTFSLQNVCQELARQIEQAEAGELNDLADDLKSVELDLQAALKAEADNKLNRRTDKIKSAEQRLQQSVQDYPQLRQIIIQLQLVI
jgi:translation initiation factor 2B subunit (eIF-2B alpha/beta/delta family)